jgi:DNA-binding NarL/FixJ family response regulator
MPQPMSDRVRSLTPRHREVVRLVSLGCNLDEIAAVLDIAPSTADNHKQAALHRLGVSKAAMLTRVAIKHRISSLSDQLMRSEKRRISLYA